MLRTTFWRPITRRPIVGPWVRFKHGSVQDGNGKESGKSDSGDSSQFDQESTELDQKNQHSVFQVQSKTSKAAPADYDANSGISKLLRQDKKPYLPKIRHERLSYEYPGLPNQDDFTKHSNKEKKIKPVTRWSRHVPKILTAVVLVWGAYVVKVWFYPAQDDSDSNDLLDPNHFHKFVITHKKQIDADHYLVEVRPKYSGWKMSYYAHYDNKSIWNGDVMWSVEIKQPQIMVVRSYTPLPLYFLKSERTRSGEKEPLLKVIDNDNDDYDKGGVMTFYVKRYDDGEVSRYITDKNVGDEIDIRGPHVDFRFSHHPLKALHERPIFRDLPSKVEAETLVESIRAEHRVPEYDTLDFYGAGTGIAPILQVLLSRNPYRGYVNVHYSAKSDTELQPLKRFMFFLEKLDRAQFHEHIDSQNERLTIGDIINPEEPKYISPMREQMREMDRKSEQTDSEKKESLKLRMAILDNDEVVEQQPRRRVKWYQNALEQAQDTSKQPKSSGALAVVCGPEGYIGYVAGPKDLATGEQGPVGGLLGAKKWDSSNVIKL